MGFKVEEKFRIILVMKEVNLTNVLELGVSGGNLVQMFNKITKDEYSTKAQ